MLLVWPVRCPTRVLPAFCKEFGSLRYCRFIRICLRGAFLLWPEGGWVVAAHAEFTAVFQVFVTGRQEVHRLCRTAASAKHLLGGRFVLGPAQDASEDAGDDLAWQGAPWQEVRGGMSPRACEGHGGSRSGSR